jgi:tetrahedral aminopeptidase
MLLKELSNAIGISGEEDEVRKIVVDAIMPHVTDLTVDSMGNVTAIQKGTQYPEYTVMIAAHMDEIGMMVTAVDSNGLIQFTNVGGIDARILPGLRVKVGKKKTPGVILWKPIHFGRNPNVVDMDSLRIDIGSTDKNGAELGERIAFDSFYAEMSETIVRGKAFDDRVGCSILIDILQNGPYPVTVAATFSVQEEIGLRGAQIATHRLNPDVAIVLEGTPAHDLPSPDMEIDAGDLPPNSGCKLGAGAVLTLMDSSMVADPRVLGFLRETADTHEIPYQFKTTRGGGTDGGRIHTTHTGVPTMVISTPCRYIHSPTALMNTDDYAHVLNLSQAVLKTITPDTFKQ